MKRGEFVYMLLAFVFSLSSCHYPQPDLADESLTKDARDSLKYLYERHYTWNANLLVRADSVDLEAWPVKGRYNRVYKGDRVVVAEFAIHPADSVDSVWVKLAHSEQVQGWIQECDLIRDFVPDDSISEAIYLFSDTHLSYFIIIFALCVVVWLVRAFHLKRWQVMSFNEIDSVYPLLLCLLVAISATVYESMQVFVPETWQHYYYNPTLSPLKVPFVLALFLTCLWLIVVVLLAVVDVLFRQLPVASAFSYLLGLASACIVCYFFFIWTTRFYIGYLLLLTFVIFFIYRVRRSFAQLRYRCGRCGGLLRQKGVCPHCGAVNE